MADDQVTNFKCAVCKDPLWIRWEEIEHPKIGAAYVFLCKNRDCEVSKGIESAPVLGLDF